MRNTRLFELNIFDEEINPTTLSKPQRLNSQLIQSLTLHQKYLMESPFLKKLAKAYEKWKQEVHKNNSAISQMFEYRKEPEFSDKDFEPFKQGKYWQMLKYLDGPHPIKSKSTNRETYQNDLLSDLLPQNHDLLQKGFDLAINSALLCDLMPQISAAGKKGSVYLLEHIVWDKNSLFYPSVTNQFQTRLINEAFWQCLYDLHHQNEYQVLENILTKSFLELNPSYAKDNIMRWNNPERPPKLISTNRELVSGTAGPESFTGLSPRAVQNYGKFLEQVYNSFSYDDRLFLMPFTEMYVKAVNCIDEDSIPYFTEEEQKELLDLSSVEEIKEK